MTVRRASKYELVSRECRLCHRIGWRAFAPVGAEGWECSNDRACRRRQERRDQTEPQ